MTKVDPNLSRFHEVPNAPDEFNTTELKRLRLLLRRLRFLEAKVRETAPDAQSNGGALFAEWEMEALEWVLQDMGYLPETQEMRTA